MKTEEDLVVQESLDLSYSINKLGIPIIPVYNESLGYFYAVVDTGSTNSFIDYNSVKKYLPENLVRKEVLTGAGNIYKIGTINTSIGLLEKEFEIKLDVLETESLLEVSNRYDRKVIALLGTDFLVKNKFIIDYGNQELYQSNKA